MDNDAKHHQDYSSYWFDCLRIHILWTFELCDYSETALFKITSVWFIAPWYALELLWTSGFVDSPLHGQYYLSLIFTLNKPTTAVVSLRACYRKKLHCKPSHGCCHLYTHSSFYPLWQTYVVWAVKFTTSMMEVTSFVCTKKQSSVFLNWFRGKHLNFFHHVHELRPSVSSWHRTGKEVWESWCWYFDALLEDVMPAH